MPEWKPLGFGIYCFHCVLREGGTPSLFRLMLLSILTAERRCSHRSVGTLRTNQGLPRNQPRSFDHEGPRLDNGFVRPNRTALCFTLKLPSAIPMFVRDPEPLLSQGELWVSLACTAVRPNFGPSTKVAIRRFRCVPRFILTIPHRVRPRQRLG